MDKGRVWLVGAGPGAGGLITIKGKDVLSQADVVIYDALIGPEILNYVNFDTKLIYAGKLKGKHHMKQEQINDLILEEAQKGNKVVRLKGGDPYVFGRGAEELELLLENDIPYEVIPGVTSAFAVPTFFGIPVTHRDHSSEIHIVSGHRKTDTIKLDYQRLAQGEGTLILLMGLTLISDITKGLMEAGMSPDIPVAVLIRGTRADGRRVIGTLSTIEKKVNEIEVAHPALIVIGDVCNLSEHIDNKKNNRLSKISVIVAGSEKSCKRLSGLLKEEGVESIELPVISIEPLCNSTTLAGYSKKILDKKYEWIVFTSGEGVSNFFREFMKISDARGLFGTKLAVIGPGTASVLSAYGLKADFIAEKSYGKNLGEELSKICNSGDRLLILRAEKGNEELVEALEKNKDLTITDVGIYRVNQRTERINDLSKIYDIERADYVMFTSASSVKSLSDYLLKEGYDTTKIKAICIGDITAKEAEKYNFMIWKSEIASLPSMVDCLKKIVNE